MKNKANLKNILIGILFIIILSVCFISINNNANNPNIVNPPVSSGKYGNIVIDEELLNIFYFYVGNADSIFIKLGENTMLIDAGKISDGPHIADFLKEMNITEIDYLIGTHDDSDHIGGIKTILDEIKVHNLYMPEIRANKDGKYSTSYQAILDRLQNKNLELTLAQNDVRFQFGEAIVILKWPEQGLVTSDNNTSVVVELNYKEQRYLFMGDLEKKMEKEILDSLNIVDVVKIAHHGSDSSTSTEFLDRIEPKFAIISSGSKHYNFPSIVVINRLLEKVSKENIYITERDGTIWLKSDGNIIEFEKLKNINLDGAKSIINENFDDEVFKDILNISYFSRKFQISYCKIMGIAV